MSLDPPPAYRDRVAEVDACREKALAEDLVARFMAEGNALRTHPQSAACEALASDLAREQREVFAAAAAIALGPPLLALILFSAAQWVIKGL